MEITLTKNRMILSADVTKSEVVISFKDGARHADFIVSAPTSREELRKWAKALVGALEA